MFEPLAKENSIGRGTEITGKVDGRAKHRVPWDQGGGGQKGSPDIVVQ